MVLKSKHYFIKILIFLFIILNGCQLQEPTKNHGIVFLKNRSEKLEVNNSNSNDVIRIIGYPHTKSVNNINEWLYFERTLTKGEYHKLGQNVLKTNNVLVLNFDKYGILIKKQLFEKEDKNKLSFSKKETENDITKKSIVEKFLSSVKSKMYGNRK
jgi:outer membrane protein assembly factor BamE (lipoprotein component of BamABCDE complex)